LTLERNLKMGDSRLLKIHPTAGFSYFDTVRFRGVQHFFQRTSNFQLLAEEARQEM
jgi:hypothetical protein